MSNVDKGIELPSNKAEMHPLAQVYLSLERHLGLRREEAIKIKPHLADKGDYLELKGSWCKGGRPRRIPILTAEARAAVDAAKSIAINKLASLIPDDKTYAKQLYFYKNQLAKHGVRRAHGLRHSYAQDCYKALTGWECPARGGAKFSELTPEQKQIDKDARLEINHSLGHGRRAIVAQYCGK